jgi:hypothetical protein
VLETISVVILDNCGEYKDFEESRYEDALMDGYEYACVDVGNWFLMSRRVGAHSEAVINPASAMQRPLCQKKSRPPQFITTRAITIKNKTPKIASTIEKN